MDDTQLEHVGMFVKVKTFLNKKAAQLNATPVIAATLAPGLSSKIDQIIQEDEDASTDISGSTELKRTLRLALEDRGFEIAAACVAYYTITVPNPVLRVKCEFVRSELSSNGGFRDAELYVKMKMVHDIAEPIKTLLTPFGVTDSDVDSMATALINYFEQLEAPFDARGERSASGKQVDRLIEQAMELLNNQLDVVMKFYVSNDPELHDYYLTARAIDQTGGGPVPDEDEEFTINAGQFSNPPTPAEVTVNSRFVITNKTENGAILRVGFSNFQNGFSGTFKEIAPGATADFKALDFGFNTGIPYFVFQNTSNPNAVNISVRAKAYF